MHQNIENAYQEMRNNYQQEVERREQIRRSRAEAIQKEIANRKQTPAIKQQPSKGTDTYSQSPSGIKNNQKSITYVDEVGEWGNEQLNEKLAEMGAPTPREALSASCPGTIKNIEVISVECRKSNYGFQCRKRAKAMCRN